ncbi:hypothetical protein VTH8203_03525 [Vibrio thalassae]|uniref:Integrase catalytic domain-containing protein n=1 Tax=Vibrio thalassae TaxID=1243014 RepID=A0A240EMF1_9VIBR|nr:hypothetical protein VTH8203_03525 [Vibrio thalassae]
MRSYLGTSNTNNIAPWVYGADTEELQKELDEWMDYYNNHRTHQEKMCCGRTPIETLEDGNQSGLKRI